MIPTLSHTQPLVRDISLQPPSRYLLTIYGATTREYFLVDDYAEGDETIAFHRGTALWATVVLPKGTQWTLIAMDEIELPTLEMITRQTREDQDHFASLDKELYPHRDKKGNEMVVTLPDKNGTEGQPIDAYPGQSKQYL